MSDWFQVKIKYLKQLDNGSITSKMDNYILNALSFTEGEARLQRILEEYISEYNLQTMAKTTIQDVIMDDSKEFFFKVKVAYVSADPDSGKEKKITEDYLIQADSNKEAHQIMEARLQGSIVDWEIPSVVQSTIVDAFPYIKLDTEEAEEPAVLEKV